MLNHLLYFQFVFIYLPVLVIGLVVYGSDFDSITGWLYVTPLIVITIIHKRVWSMRSLRSASIEKMVSAVGAIAGVMVYAPLHMGYWDEHSVSQALLMVLLGVCSYLLSVIAAAKINARQTTCRSCAPLALAVIGGVWFMAVYFPMIALFFLTLLLLVSVFAFNAPQYEATEVSVDTLPSDIIAKYIVFLIAIDISCVVWDYQVNTHWALYVGASFVAAALGYFLKLRAASDRVELGVYIVALANFTLAVLWPAYLLWNIHVMAAGFCLGYLLPQAISKSGEQTGSQLSMGWVVWFFMGWVLSNAWYANLQWAFTRFVLVVPFAILAFVYLKDRIRSAKYHL